MAGASWHGFDENNPRKIWSVKDCPRNLFQLGYLMGEDVYTWFDRELIRHEYRQYYKNGERTDPMPHQFDMARHRAYVPLSNLGCLPWEVGKRSFRPNGNRAFRHGPLVLGWACPLASEHRT